MIISEELAAIRIRRIIFHEVPRHLKGGSSQPTLADEETPIDAGRSSMLKSRLTQVFGSKAAYPVKFTPGTASPVPKEVDEFTEKSGAKLFVEMSQRLAKYLFEQQTGPVSGGLLCVIEVVTGGLPGIALLKLEKEQGAELHWRTRDGKKSYEMSVLDNLVLTDGTRLFKSVLFLRESKSKFRIMACDPQKNGGTSTDVAQFWLRFLGCQFVENPRVTTQKWFDATVRFINEKVEDAVAKNDIYESLFSEMRSNRNSFVPKQFVEDYIPKEYRKDYLQFAKDSGLGMSSFHKDLTDIANRLRRRSFHTSKGVTVTAPADREDLVEIEKSQIVVHDELTSIN